MAFGVTDNGFILKRLSDILASIISNLETVTDSVSGESLTPDLADENDPLIQIVNSFGDGLAEAWEETQQAYNQFDPLKASGAGLSGTVQLNGLRRLPGTNSTVTVTLTGTPLLSVDAGKRISKIDDTSVFVLPAFTIGVGGTAAVAAESLEEGSIEAVAGSLVKIVTPVSGWTASTNALDAIPGTFEEGDVALVRRQQQSTANTGRSTIEDMYSAIVNLPNVTFAKVYQNVTLATDGRGILGKSVAVVVQGGDDEDISEQIFLHMADGMRAFGSTVASETDVQGLIYNTSFSRATEVDIYVEVNAEIVNPNVIPTDVEDVIIAAILDYVSLGASGLGIDEGFDRDGFVPGENILASELYTPVNFQPGLKINSIYVAGTPSPAADNVPIDWDEIGAFDSARIDINIT